MRDLMAELHEAEIRTRIKQARNEAGLTQSTLADLLGVIPRTVQNYESDHVPWTRIRDIADVTGKTTRWLLHGDTAAEEDLELAAHLNMIETKLDALIGALAADRLEQELDEAAAQEGPSGDSSEEAGVDDDEEDEEPPAQSGNHP